MHHFDRGEGIAHIVQIINENYSHLEGYLAHWLTDDLRQASQDHPVIVLTGARQVGKSTLLRNTEPLASWRFHTLDDYDTLRQAREDPRRSVRHCHATTQDPSPGYRLLEWRRLSDVKRAWQKSI